MNFSRKHPIRWPEPIRLGATVLWVATLSFWTFYQGIWFYSGGLLNVDSLSSVSAALRTIRPLWYASFFPAAALGLAGYIAFHRPPRRRATAVDAGLDWLTTSQTYATLCIAICAFTLNYRILPFLPFCTSGEARASEHLLTFHWGTTDWMPVAPVLEQQAMIGVLVAALVAVQAWGLLPRLGGSRRRFLMLVGLLLLGGLAIPWLGLFEALPSPAPQVFFEVDEQSPTTRGLLLGDANSQEAAELTLARYLTTHTDQGTATPLHELRDNRLPEWGHLEPEELAYRRCELCQLPGTAVFTTAGLPLRLAPEEPTDPGPTRVIEIPRRPGTGRLYDPATPPGVAEMITLPVSAIPGRLDGADWVVAKIDFSVSMDVVRDLLFQLQGVGVRRVDLAVVPYGFRPLPPAIPLVSFAERADTPTYTPSERLRSRWDLGIRVRKYVPPPPRPDPRLRCTEVHRWELQNAWSRFLLDPAGSLPPRVTFPVAAGERYGQFVGVLQGALAGGAETIVIALQEDIQ